MKSSRLIWCLVVAVLSISCRERAQTAQEGAEPTGNPERVPTDTGSLFLTDADIAHLKRILPGLADASQQGPKETAAYLAKLDIPFDRITQVLSNISVAYSAIKFEEWMREINPMLDTSRSAYRQRLQEGQHQLQQITARYKDARRGRRTALDVNEEIVRKNLPDVELLLVRMQGMKASSMPFHQ